MFAALIAQIAAGETAKIVQRMKRAALAYAVAGLLLFLALIFALIAVYVWMAVKYGPISAAMVFTAVFAVLGVVVIVGHRVTSRVQARRAARRRSVDAKAIATTAAVAAIPALLARKGTGIALLVPLLGAVGYLIYQENRGGRRPEDEN